MVGVGEDAVGTLGGRRRGPGGSGTWEGIRERDFGKFWARAVAWAGGKMTHGWAVVDWPLLGQFRSEQKWIHGRSTR